MAEATLTYRVDGTIIAAEKIEVGAPIIPPTIPEREGYDFSGWINLPAVMPDENLTVDSTFTPDSYTLTEMVGDEIFSTRMLSSGTDLTKMPLPEKKGYTFSGWRKKYKKMPKSNLTLRGSFKINRYRLIFEIEGMTFERSMEYGAPLDRIAEPSREHYSFSGWGKLPATMPDHDLRFSGSFHLNLHTLTYLLEGKQYQSEQLGFGDEIKAPTVPQKDGYIFSGWRGLPKTMPDESVTIEGRYYKKKSHLDFMVDGKKFAFVSLPAGASIPMPSPPKKDGMVFRGWTNMPDVMQEGDMTVNAVFDKADE